MCAVWVWAYVCTSETTTTITVTCGSVTSTSFLWLLFETWWHHSRAGQGLSSFWGGHIVKKESLVYVFSAAGIFLSFGTSQVWATWLTLVLRAISLLPHPHLGPGVTCALFSPQVERHSPKGPWTIEGQNSPALYCHVWLYFDCPFYESTVSKELFLILLDI